MSNFSGISNDSFPSDQEPMDSSEILEELSNLAIINKIPNNSSIEELEPFSTQAVMDLDGDKFSVRFNQPVTSMIETNYDEPIRIESPKSFAKRNTRKRKQSRSPFNKTQKNSSASSEFSPLRRSERIAEQTHTKGIASEMKKFTDGLACSIKQIMEKMAHDITVGVLAQIKKQHVDQTGKKRGGNAKKPPIRARQKPSPPNCKKSRR